MFRKNRMHFQTVLQVFLIRDPVIPQAKLDMAGQTVKLGTFLCQGKECVFGYKMEERNGTKLVNSVWCKLCTKNYNTIIKSRFYSGEIKTSEKTFVEGTSDVTMYKLDRHLKSKSLEIHSD